MSAQYEIVSAYRDAEGQTRIGMQKAGTVGGRLHYLTLSGDQALGLAVELIHNVRAANGRQKREEEAAKIAN